MNERNEKGRKNKNRVLLLQCFKHNTLNYISVFFLILSVLLF